MEDLKLAIETVIVGLLALPWVWMLAVLLSSAVRIDFGKLGNTPEWSKTAAAIGVVAVAYLLGAIVSPIADEALDEQYQGPLGNNIKSDNDIRRESYGKYIVCSDVGLLPEGELQQDALTLVAAARKAACEKNKDWRQKELDGCLPVQPAHSACDAVSGGRQETESVKRIYQHQKFMVLRDSHLSATLKLMKDQIVIVRGAALNAFLLALCSAFLAIAHGLVPWCQRKYGAAGAYAAAATVPVLTIFLGWILGPDKYDTALALLVLAAALCGLLSALLNAGRMRSGRGGYWRVALAASLLCVLTYSGWVHIEKDYDKHVIHFFRTVKAGSKVETFSGACDGSAGVALDAGRIVVASDEDNIFRVYRVPGGGDPVHTLDLSSQLQVTKEVDIEGAALAGNNAYWIGSHGTTSGGKPALDRSRFFATDRAGAAIQGMRRDLLQDMLRWDTAQSRPLGLEQARAHASKQGGINIEALAATPSAALLIGFRSPTVPVGGKRMALIITLSNPAEYVTGREARLGPAVLLDLNGLGVRDMAWCAAQTAYWIIAGSAGEENGIFRLFVWNGKETERQPKLMRTLPARAGSAPEAIVFPPGEKSAYILYDEGDVRINGGQRCKDGERRSFAGMVLPVD